MSEPGSLTVVIARRDARIDVEGARAAVAALPSVRVLDPIGVEPARVGLTPSGHWTQPATGRLGWAAEAALAAVESEWVLLLDADERVEPLGIAEILRAIADPEAPDGFELRIRRRFLGRDLRAAGRSGSAGVRLARVRRAALDPHGNGFALAPDARRGQLERALVHDAFGSLEACMARLDVDGSREARILVGLGERVSHRGVAFGPIGAFLYRWLRAGSWLDGTLGLVQAAFEAAFVTIRAAKLWELSMPARLRRVPSLPEPPR